MTISFEDELGKKHFEFLFIGFILGGSLQTQKGLPLLRKEVTLFEKLESISELKPCGKKMPNGEAERHLVNGGILEITMDEYDLLCNYISATPWQTGSPARDAIETLDWLQKNGNS